LLKSTPFVGAAGLPSTTFSKFSTAPSPDRPPDLSMNSRNAAR
jgi:hypothetical protein